MMTLASDLFAEDEWRILWWEVLLRMDADSSFPKDVDDLSFLAMQRKPQFAIGRTQCVNDFARSWRWCQMAVTREEFMTSELAEVTQLLRSFVFQCTNPLYAMRQDVDGHEILPVGGHVGAGWRSVELPVGGQVACPC